MNWKEHKKQLMKDPAVRKEYEALEPEYKLARQSAIARLESAGSLPSLSTVKRVAEALDADLYVAVRPRSIRSTRPDR
jgi:predicted transcriptional regulator